MGDGLPNDPTRPRKVTFEKLFAALLHREELEYKLEDDVVESRAESKGRFVPPEHACVFSDDLRRIALCKGTRAAVKRRGFRTYV